MHQSIGQRLLTIAESFLYKVPPLKQSSGHRAEDWGLANPTMTARLELVGVDDVLEIRVFDATSPAEQPVARCPVRCAMGSPPIDAIVDPVVDSSRYFVLRCEDDKKRHAYVGIGFREREVAYDFKATIQDFARSVRREETALEAVRRREDAGETGEPELDLKLKGSIKISLGASSSSSPAPARTGAIAANAPVPKLAPPPAGITPPKSVTEDGSGADDGGDDDDDFGDFESAPA